MRPAFPILIIACLFAITAAAEVAAIAADFKAAYGRDDGQTGETALAWFGGFSFSFRTRR